MTRKHKPIVAGHDAIESALGLWRDGWKQTRRSVMSREWRHEYATAVTAVIPELVQYRTMQELVTAYYQSPPVVDAAVEQGLHPASGHILNFGLVEDAAYWRRACQLLGQETPADDGA